MTHLYIELNTGLTEEVNSSIISKLYELVISGDLDETSDLKGRLHSTSGKKIAVNYLNAQFQDLYITADTLYEYFEDSNTESIIKRYVGNSEGVALSDMQNMTGAFGGTYTNTNTSRQGSLFLDSTERQSITKFNEFLYFTGIYRIDTQAFSGCTNLEEITLPSNVTDILNDAFKGTKIRTIDLTHVLYIGYQAFQDSQITGVINLPNIIAFRATNGTFGQGGNSSAFSNCSNITEVNLGSGLQYFDLYSTFYGCTNLIKVTGLSNFTTIPGNTFYNCTSLVDVDIDWTKVTRINDAAFRNCSISLNLDLTNVIVGKEAFYGTTNVTITNLPRMTEYQFGLFLNINGLTSIVIPKEVLTLGNYTFAYCSNLLSIAFEQGFQFTKLVYGMFRNCKLSSVVIPEGITVIDNECFANNSTLTSVDIPSTITAINSNAFAYGNLGTFICRATTPPTLANNMFAVNNINIYVPDASVSAYQSASNWSTYSSKIKGISQLPNS